MSQLKLTADSGGGTVAIKAPASTTGNAALDLTVPGTASATLDTLNRAGNILQVIQTFKGDTTSFTSNSQTTFADISGISVTITPSSASSKILVYFTVNVSCSSQNRNNTIRLLRGSTVVGASTSGGVVNGSIFDRTADDDLLIPKSNMFLDSPATTSATTYKLQWTCEGSGGNQTYYLNRRAVGTNEGASSHITVMEVAA